MPHDKIIRFPTAGLISAQHDLEGTIYFCATPLLQVAPFDLPGGRLRNLSEDRICNNEHRLHDQTLLDRREG
jgi:hypothetical protein